MKLYEAQSIAVDIADQLRPHCERIEIAGSIRRHKPEVGDIEIVAIPKPYEVGLFASGIAPIVERWRKVKGELPGCKYTQRILPQGIKLDLFFATPRNFGSILLIRTGDWEFSKKFIGCFLPRNGYKQENGFVSRRGEIVPVKEEIDMFRLAGLEYIEPQARNRYAL